MSEALPNLYAITGSLIPDDSTRPILQQASGRAWLQRFARLLTSDVTLIQLRVKQLTTNQLDDIIHACLDLSYGSNKRLLLNGAADTVSSRGLAGIHLTSRALLEAAKRPLPDEFLVGASCHSPEELKHARAIGCDFACLSPVKPTRSHVSDDVLGLARFTRWVSDAGIPVFGLGGLVQEDLDLIVNAGGQGVAGISAFW